MSDSPTDSGTEQPSGSNEPVLDNQQPNEPAENQEVDTSTDKDSPSTEEPENNQPTPEEEHGSATQDDKSLTNFAKSQGIDDLDALDDTAKRLLKVAHDNQKQARSNMQQGKLKEELEDVHRLDTEELDTEDPYVAGQQRTDAEVAQLRAEQKVNSFYLRNPEAVDYDKEMGEIVTEVAEKDGKSAARYLSSDLDRLLVLAKAKRGSSDASATEERIRQEERESLRKRQEASADGGQAQQPNTSSKKLTREDINSMPDEEYVKLRDSGELDAMIARGDLY